MDLETQRIIVGTIAIIVLTLFWGTLFYYWFKNKLMVLKDG